MRRYFTYKLMIFAAVLAVAFAFAACSADTGKTEEAASPSPKESTTTEAAVTAAEDTMSDDTVKEGDNMNGEKVFTLEELSQYNGKDGMPAYVAVDGVVYDVSEKPLWAGGEHQNQHSAGADLSEAILQSPHGKAKLNDLPVVGTLAEE